MKKISICTICMNRLMHLQETLPLNIEQNRDYPNVEFVVLDYNSQDGMEAWMKSDMRPYIDAGLLKYYKTYEPEYFHISHSKNMVLKLATGDIKCLVDADNFAGPGYADWVASVFASYGDNTIVTTLRKDRIPYRDQGGKLCFHTDLLNRVNGFDESLVGYGMDDVDLVNRLEKTGGSRFFLTEDKYLQFIGHSNEERLRNHPLINKLKAMYLQISDQMKGSNVILYLMKDNSFFEVSYHYEESLKNNLVLSYVGWTIKPGGEIKGRWEQSAAGIQLSYENNITSTLMPDGGLTATASRSGRDITWKRIAENDEFYLPFVMGYGECVNRLKYIQNDVTRDIINKSGWGMGIVYRNADTSQPLKVS